MSTLITQMKGQEGKTYMRQGFGNWNRSVASSTVLAVMMLVSAGQSPAAEPKGELTAKQVKALVASAKTPADHIKLAHHFTAMAVKHETEAQEHEALAAEYTRNPQMGAEKHPMATKSAEHCKFFAEHCRDAAKEMRAMAAEHEAMARSLPK